MIERDKIRLEPGRAAPSDVGADLVSGVVATSPRAKRQILFVDDEAAVLQGLRSVLRPQRHEWDMSFAAGGPAALEEIKQRSFDVVVTDMRMPIIDGAELLRQTKELQPRAVRIVLSGQTDAETTMKSVFTAHQFLAKPCDIEKLRSVVKRACDLNMLVTADELRALAGDVSVLPAAPRTYLAISQALANPACGINDVASIVELEPALCAKVLQVVNSAFFGLPRAVSSVAQATNYLGALALRNLALAMETVAATARAQLPLSKQELLDFQTNSLLVGLLGRRWFAADRRKADEAFVAGMLRDMGHLVLAAQSGAAAANPDCHGALGAYLLGLWGLPHNVLEPVAFHEHPELVEHDALEVVDVVHLADRIAAELAPSPFQPTTPPLDVERLTRLGACPKQLELLRTDAKDVLTHTRELLRA
jgi:HD-like signal output (HDOD) protein